MLMHVNNKRGSAIIMVLVTVTLLLVLGMAVITLSLGTLTTNTADATTNDTYYAAEAGINSAIEHVKTEVVKYYAQMSDASGSDYTSLYEGFFSGIASNSSASFAEPDIQNMNTITTFGAGNFDGETNTGDILISCEATAADGTKYVVNGSVNVLRIDLRSGGGLTIPELAVFSGGTLNLDTKSKMTVSGHDVVVNSFIDNSNKKDNLTLNNGATLKYLHETAIGPLEDTLSYPGYADPIISDVDLFINTSNFSINWSNVPQEPVGIISTTGSNLIISNCTVPDGVIHSGGNITASNGSFYADLYCDGNFEAKNGDFYGDIYCRGNVSISNGNFYGNIICGGIMTLSHGVYH